MDRRPGQPMPSYFGYLDRVEKRRHVSILLTRVQCINQADNTERGSQVANMCEIYRAATEVIVFLGDGKHHRILGHSRDQFPGPQVVFDHSSSDDAQVSQFLKRWNSSNSRSAQALDVMSLLRLLASLQSVPLKPLVGPLKTIPDACLATLFEALRMMMRCPWWDRMWVVQEIIVARKVTFQYGRVSVPWSVLTAAALRDARLDSLPHEYMTVLGFYSRRVAEIEYRRQTWKMHRKTALLSLLREFSDRGASDDRDKIFALLGLCSVSTLVEPDYSLEVASTYKLATLDAICTTRTLSVLSGDLGRKNRQDLPSWVPDWSATFDEHDRRRAVLFGGIYNAYGKKLTYVSSSHGSWSPRVQQMYSSRHRDQHESHVWRQLGYLLGELRARGPGFFLPRCYRAVFESYPSASDSVKNLHTCKDLAMLCEDWYSRPGHMLADRGSISEIGGRLHLWGDVLGTVKFISEPLFSSTDMSATRVAISAWWQLVVNHPLAQVHVESTAAGYHEAEMASKLSFATTLVASTKSTAYGLERLVETDEPALIAWLEDLIDLSFVSTVSSSRAPKAETLNPFTHAMRMAATRRVFFITDMGKMGLGPASMQRGDEVYVLPGGEVPFILRHRQKNQYSLIGDCYLEGAMDGFPGDNDPPEPWHGYLPADVLRHMAEMWEGKADKLMGTNPITLSRLVERGRFHSSASARWWEFRGSDWIILDETSARLGESTGFSDADRVVLEEMDYLDRELARLDEGFIMIV